MKIAKAYARTVTQYPKLTLFLSLLIVFSVASGLASMTVRTNQDADLPEDDPIVATKNRIDKIFGDKTEIMIGIKHPDIFNPATLTKIGQISVHIPAHREHPLWFNVNTYSGLM